MPPPASGLPARLVLGPALRAQSDRRLARLVREGYESAFEEIVRRYRRPLDRFAASIVGGRSEDVTQDSFRKALVALRDGEGELELRPWLYRIVRNTALNDLRDRPPAAAELAEDLMGGGRSAAAEAEQREEVAKLVGRLQALPPKQRAALVMRELEGMGHEEIAAALGVSGGAARQAIARGRAAVRTGFGALVPLPRVRGLLAGSDGASEAAIGGAGAAIGAGGLGAGAMKLGLATVVVAGSIGAGVAIDHHGSVPGRSNPPQAAAPAPEGPRGDGLRSTPSPVLSDVDDTGRSTVEGHLSPRHDRHRHDGDENRGSGGRAGEDDGHVDHHGRDDRGGDNPSRLNVSNESVTAVPDRDDHHGRGGNGRGSSGSDGDDPDNSGQGGAEHDGSHGDNPGHGDEGARDGSGRSRGGSGSGGGSGSQSSGSGFESSGSPHRGRASDDLPAEVVGTVAAQPSSGGNSGSSSGGSPGGPDPAGDPGPSGGDSESSGGSDSSDSDSDAALSSPSTSVGASGSPGGPSETSEIFP